MKTNTAIVKEYQKLVNSFDPWKQQVVIETSNGTMVVELLCDDREFHLFASPEMNVGETKGLNAINEKVIEIIASGRVTNVYVDSL